MKPHGVPLVLLAASLAACSGTAIRRLRVSEDAYPFVLPSPAAIEQDFLWRQKIVAQIAGREHGFEAVLQKRGDTLTLIGLTPAGTTAFVLTQRGDDIAYRSYLSTELPIPPRFILVDIHRTYTPLGEAAVLLPDGDRRLVREGEEIIEIRRKGRLCERRFRRLTGSPSGEIRITYAEWSTDDGTPKRVVLDNRWFGYRLTITTVAAERL